MLKEQVDLLLHKSSAVYVTLVTPIGKTSPLICETVRNSLPQLSVTLGEVQLTFALQLLLTFTVISTGQFEIIGAWSSNNLMDWEQEEFKFGSCGS